MDEPVIVNAMTSPKDTQTPMTDLVSFERQFSDEGTGKPNWPRLVAYVDDLEHKIRLINEQHATTIDVLEQTRRELAEAMEQASNSAANYLEVVADAHREMMLREQAERRFAEAEKDAKIIAAARAVVPHLKEGWDEMDNPADIEAADAACNRLIKAVEERNAAIAQEKK